MSVSRRDPICSKCHVHPCEHVRVEKRDEIKELTDRLGRAQDVHGGHRTPRGVRDSRTGGRSVKGGD